MGKLGDIKDLVMIGVIGFIVYKVSQGVGAIAKIKIPEILTGLPGTKEADIARETTIYTNTVSAITKNKEQDLKIEEVMEKQHEIKPPTSDFAQARVLEYEKWWKEANIQYWNAYNMKLLYPWNEGIKLRADTDMADAEYKMDLYNKKIAHFKQFIR